MRARQEPDALRVEREINDLSGSGTNLNEAVQPTHLEAGVRASLWDLWSAAIAERNTAHSLAHWAR